MADINTASVQSALNIIQHEGVSGTVLFFDKNLKSFELSNEAALFKGGAALKALKEVALRVAGAKAAQGRYRAAADILAVAFPKQYKAYVEFMAMQPWANANAMAVFLDKCERAEPGKNGFTAKQNAAKDLLRALRADVPALRSEPVVVQG